MPFHAAQEVAWECQERTVVISAGTQSGKTKFEPPWLWREIQARGRGDYLAATASYELFDKKFLPTFLGFFEQGIGRGRYWAGSRIIELSDPEGKFWATSAHKPMWARILLGSAQAAGGLEAITAKGAVLDEAGQDQFTVQAYRAITRRLHIHRARMLLGTTLYNLGWVKGMIERAQGVGAEHEVRYALGGEIERTHNAIQSLDIVQFDSIVNPQFSAEEYEKARAEMPADEFLMFYRGRIARLRTLIYDCFDTAVHRVAHFMPHRDWLRAVGIDPLGERTAAVWVAFDPKKEQLHVYREYAEPFGATFKGHAEAMLALSASERVVKWIGGGPSERQARTEFRAAGIPLVEPSVSDVWVGIGRVYTLFKTNALVVHDNCEMVLDELGRYQRKRDRSGNPTDIILEKEQFHMLDSLRYCISWLTEPTVERRAVYSPVLIGRQF